MVVLSKKTVQNERTAKERKEEEEREPAARENEREELLSAC